VCVFDWIINYIDKY